LALPRVIALATVTNGTKAQRIFRRRDETRRKNVDYVFVEKKKKALGAKLPRKLSSVANGREKKFRRRY